MGFLLRYGSKDLQEGSPHGQIAAIFLSWAVILQKKMRAGYTRLYKKAISLLENQSLRLYIIQTTYRFHYGSADYHSDYHSKNICSYQVCTLHK